MNQGELLKELREESYIILKPSPVHGIGTFALRDIPKGCKNIFSKSIGEWIKIPQSEIEKLPEHSKNLVETYCLYDDENYFIPDYGFKLMDLVNYLNHSSTPNVVSVNHGEYFEALYDIAAGDELFVNYELIVKTDETYQ